MDDQEDIGFISTLTKGEIYSMCPLSLLQVEDSLNPRPGGLACSDDICGRDGGAVTADEGLQYGGAVARFGKDLPLQLSLKETIMGIHIGGVGGSGLRVPKVHVVPQQGHGPLGRVARGRVLLK